MFYEIAHTFLHYCQEIIPYFIGSIFVAAVIDAKCDPTFFAKRFKKGSKAILNATLLGAIIPACSCTSMPIAESLKSKSNHLGAVMAFILVSPALGPHTILLTLAILGPEFTIFRIVSACALAFVGGFIFDQFQQKNISGFNQLEPESQETCCNSQKKIQISFWSITKKLVPYFIVGLIIASVIAVIIPESFIQETMNEMGLFKYLLSAIIGIPVYVCAGEEIPITQSLLGLGLDKGAAFTFMMGSVGTCIPTMLMSQKMVGKRATGVYVVMWFIYAMLSGWIFNYVWG